MGMSTSNASAIWPSLRERLLQKNSESISVRTESLMVFTRLDGPATRRRLELMSTTWSSFKAVPCRSSLSSNALVDARFSGRGPRIVAWNVPEGGFIPQVDGAYWVCLWSSNPQACNAGPKTRSPAIHLVPVNVPNRLLGADDTMKKLLPGQQRRLAAVTDGHVLTFSQVVSRKIDGTHTETLLLK